MRQTKQFGQLILALAVVAVLSLSALAQGSDSKNAAKAALMKVTVEGELVALEAVNGGKPFALKITRAADAQGNELGELKGQTLRLGPTARVKTLTAKHNPGSKLMVMGSLNPASKLLSVATYKAAMSGGGSGSK